MEFDEAQLEALRRMVEDWIDEGFTTPPYEAAYYDVFEKLEITEDRRGVYDIRRPAGKESE